MNGAEASARFWDGAPCGRGDSFEDPSATRFKREPWVPALLGEVAKHDGLDRVDGTTMVRECFGVPVLKSYTKGGARRLFSQFDIVSVSPRGFLWLVEARKPHPTGPRGRTS